MLIGTTDYRLGRVTCFLTGVAALTSAQRRAIVLSKIRRGMLLSQEAKHNVTAAEEACRVWESVLSRPSVVSSSSSSIVTQDVLSLSKTLYASCLVRVGRDGEAVSVYDSCLNNNDNNQKEDIAFAGSSHDTIKWRLAKARCLQRLLKYSDAAEELSRVMADAKRNNNEKNAASESEQQQQQQARMGAATCILRSTGDVARARKILAEASTSTAPRAVSSSLESRKILRVPTDALLLSSCLEYLETGNENRVVNRLQEVLDDALEASRIKGDGIRPEEDNNTTNTSTTSFLLYRWILATLKRNHRHNNKRPNKEESASPQASEERTTAATSTTFDPKDLFMELIRINTSPLDDPNLLRLDDKIKLHNMLTTVEGRLKTAGELSLSSSPPLTSYWPDGLVLPAKSSEWKDMIGHHRDDEDSSSLWIAKSRAGYGSHGNRILTHAEASDEINGGIVDETDKPAHKEIKTETEPYLLQRMVDPLMLLNGYKFSLRIYVIYFSSDEAYISSKGLVKLASEPLLLVDEDDSDAGESAKNRTADASMHMTNSGRETVMQQEDLEYLWSEIDSNAEKEELWKDICRASAETLLLRYPERIASLEHAESESDLDSDRVFREQKRTWKNRREYWGIPKILGLDFVVQQDAAKKQPWLVEVNRFPGLEPRDEDDRKIKYRVVRDAWRKASERLATTIMLPTKDDEGGDGDRGEDQHALFLDGILFESLSCGERDGTNSSLERLQLETQ